MSDNLDFYKWFDPVSKKLESFRISISTRYYWGKGYLVHEFASHAKANLLFSHYQAAWFGFNKD